MTVNHDPEILVAAQALAENLGSLRGEKIRWINPKEGT